MQEIEEEIKGGGQELVIATGRSRQELKWKHERISWADLVRKLSETTKTYETVKEFKSLPKSKQDSIKDIGGFVGGKLKEGRRKRDSVEYRTLVTLDADTAPADFLDTIDLYCNFSMVVYSTHKHTAEAPRLRLVIPLSRAVNADEYEAVARKIASDYGIDYFDDSTYEGWRLMYWPSTSKDGEYIFRHYNYDVLDPDKVLESYIDWKDTSCWSYSSRVYQRIEKKTADKQANPLDKDNAVGIFCRTYDVHRAIAKFLPDVYEQCASKDRYTYLKGSSSGGLVVYGEGLFAYSNHATDPAGQELCNAFDLVRLHLFGSLDENVKQGTNASKTPSYKAMVELCNKDEEVRSTFDREREERFNRALEDNKLEGEEELGGDESEAPDGTEEATEGADEKKEEWKLKLTVGFGGEYEPTLNNLLLIIRNDPKLRAIKGLDIFKDRYIVKGKLPWKRARGNEWTDIDDAGLRWYIEERYGIEARQKIIDALGLVFEERAFHPVKQFIQSREWDGVQRVETVLIDYLGADDTPYTREVTRKMLVAAVARIYEPGVKFDQMLVLVGDQGIGKSLLIHNLSNGWCNDTITDIKGKEAYESLKGSWLIEMGELVALRKSEREAMKNYISKTEDTYRKAYGRNVTTDRRQCVFFGTTNEREFLDDSTGNRRYWVVDTCKDARKKLVWEDLPCGGEEVRQIWAEAYLLYKQGEVIMELSEEARAVATKMQEDFSEDNVWLGAIEKYLDTPIPSDWPLKSIYERVQYYKAIEASGDGGVVPQGALRDTVCAYEIWCECIVGNENAKPTKADTRLISQCLQKLGWGKSNMTRFGAYGVQRARKKNVTKS